MNRSWAGKRIVWCNVGQPYSITSSAAGMALGAAADPGKATSLQASGRGHRAHETPASTMTDRIKLPAGQKAFKG
jgi:hypothetical protein